MRYLLKIAVAVTTLVLFTSAATFAQYTFVTATVKDASGNLYAKGSWQANLNTSGIPPGQLVTFQDSTSFQTAFSGQMNTSGNFSINLPDNNVIEPSGTQWTFGFCEHYSTELQSPSGVCFNLTLPITGRSMNITTQVQAASLPLPSPSAGVSGSVPNPLNTVAIQDKGGQVYNVLAYGAKCDGSTDDTTAIQAAITAAAAVDGTAFVPAGSNPCVIASFLTLPGAMTLLGAGNMAASGSSLKFTGTGAGACTDAQVAPVNTGFMRFSSGSVRVTGLTLQVTNGAAGSCLFNLQDGTETGGVEIDHNNILGGSATTDVNTAIFLYSVDTIRIHNNAIKDWGQMIVGGAHTWANVLIDHNVISTGAETSKAMVQTPVGANCFSSRISGNVFEGYQSTNGISTTCSNGITISNNYMGDSSATGGTWITGNGTLIDNYIDGSGQLGSGGQALSGSFTAIGNWIYGKSLIAVSGNFTGNTFLSGPSAGCFVTMNQSSVVVSTMNDFTNSGGAANSYCHANGLTPHPVVISNQDTDATTGRIQTGVTVKYNGRVPGAFSTLPTCSADTEGNSIPVTDSTTNTPGATIAGGGANHVLGYCDGTNWTVPGSLQVGLTWYASQMAGVDSAAKINACLTAAAGNGICLAQGLTGTALSQINVPSNTHLVMVGNSLAFSGTGLSIGASTNVMIEGDSTQQITSSVASGVSITTGSHIVIRDLVVNGYNSANTTGNAGFFIFGAASDVVFEHDTAQNGNGQCFRMDSASGVPSNVWIDRSSCISTAGASSEGIGPMGNNIWVTNNYIYKANVTGILVYNGRSGTWNSIVIKGNSIGDSSFSNGGNAAIQINPTSNGLKNIVIEGNSIWDDQGTPTTEVPISVTNGGSTGNITGLKISGNTWTNTIEQFEVSNSVAAAHLIDSSWDETTIGAPSGVCATGSTDRNLTGGSNTTFYVCQSNGWVPALGLPNAVTTVGTTAIAANTCTTATTVTMTGLATGMTLSFTPTSDTSGVTGWGANGGLMIAAWPTTNLVSYKVCNQTSASITPSASVTFNISAQ